MLVTSLNIVGDSACALAVAKSEDSLNEKVYNSLGSDEEASVGNNAPIYRTAKLK